MGCAIWHHLHNFKNVKNAYEGVLLLITLQRTAFMNKTLSKAILLRTKFRKTLLKIREDKNKKSLAIQISYGVLPLANSKKYYSDNFNEENICDNRKIWLAL